MLQNRSHQHLPINQRIHPHPIKSLIPHHKLIPCPLIKPYCCLIPGKHMQPHLPAPCRTRLHLHPLHQPGSQPTPPKLRCNIQRHHIPHASPLRRPDMHNTKPRQYPIQLRNHNLRTPRLRKGPHIPPRKPERLLKAHHIQRIHCIQIPRPISTKQKVTHLSIISVPTSPNPKRRHSEHREEPPYPPVLRSPHPHRLSSRPERSGEIPALPLLYRSTIRVPSTPTPGALPFGALC